MEEGTDTTPTTKPYSQHSFAENTVLRRDIRGLDPVTLGQFSKEQSNE